MISCDNSGNQSLGYRIIMALTGYEVYTKSIWENSSFIWFLKILIARVPVSVPWMPSPECRCDFPALNMARSNAKRSLGFENTNAINESVLLPVMNVSTLSQSLLKNHFKCQFNAAFSLSLARIKIAPKKRLY